VGAAWAYAVRHPEKLLQAAALVFHFFARWFKEADRRYVAADIEGNVTSAVKRLDREAPGVVPYGLKIEWVAATSPDAFVEKNNVVVRMNYRDEQDRNWVHALVAFVPKAVIPEARHYLEENIEESIDLTFVKRMLTSMARTTSVNYFFEEYLVPAIRANPDLAEICSCLDRLDEMGWLTRILLAEFLELGKALFPRTPNGTEAGETIRFLRFLDNFAKRKHGEEVTTAFVGRHIRMSIVLVARPEVREAYGISPHFRRIRTVKKRGAERIYIGAFGKNIGPAKGLAERVAKQLGFEIVATDEYKGRFFGKRPIKAICIVCHAMEPQPDSKSETEVEREEESELNSALSGTE